MTTQNTLTRHYLCLPLSLATLICAACSGRLTGDDGSGGTTVPPLPRPGVDAGTGTLPLPASIGSLCNAEVANAAQDHGSHDHGSHDHGSHMSGHNPHEAGSAKHSEHDAAFALVPMTRATHVAVASGSWFNANTWREGEVPGAGARVVIPHGLTVVYDSVSDAALGTVRVDGQLDFSTAVSSKMVVDTFVVDAIGIWTIGTPTDPVRADVSVEVLFANNGNIDTEWDTQLLSRGVIAHGAARIHGAAKTSHLKVGRDPRKGDTSLTLAYEPVNWRVGDTLVLAGTLYDGYTWDNDIGAKRHYLPEDEVLTLTGINGREVSFDTPLEYDHLSPRSDLKTSVANYSRNITFANEGGADIPVHQRGHVMFMHSDNVDVRYASFWELGRTDKSVESRPVGTFNNVQPDSNAQGRYSLHFHRTGTSNPRQPACAIGNAVYGAPGWGYVHHDANVILHENASYNTFGAGYVAETGNEIGNWTRNIAIYAKGRSWAAPKNDNDTGAQSGNYDVGRTGDGFWFSGRMVEAHDNVAASVNHGYAYLHRDYIGALIKFPAELFDFPEALNLSPEVGIDDAPILHFRGNEAFAAKEGMHVVKANPRQGHDVHSQIKGFTAWNVRTGAHIEYTSHYLLTDFDVVARPPKRFSNPSDGISIGNNTSDMAIIRPRIAGFPKGIVFSNHHTFSIDDNLKAYVVFDSQVDGATETDLETNGAPVRTLGADMTPAPLAVRLDPALYTSREAIVTGEKTDGLGVIPIPVGTDEVDGKFQEVIRILESDGFLTAPDGTHYFVLEQYFTDRFSGEIAKLGLLVEIDTATGELLQNTHHSYGDAVFAGMLNMENRPPLAADDEATTSAQGEVTINLLANDGDPDGDTIRVDGIVQPEYGRVFDNGDGTVLYRRDFGYEQTDQFRYWVTDGFGTFTPATVTVR